MDSVVMALTVFDDGGGPALYAGGGFSTAGDTTVNKIAKLQSDQWLPLGMGIGTANGQVWVMGEFDDGTAPALFVGGDFTVAAGQEVNHIAKWDGTSWSSLESGLNDSVQAVVVFDAGDGPALFVGGGFTMAGDIPSVRIAKWASICVADFDGDGDGDIDLIDLQAFVECLTGPVDSIGPDCAVFDENGDSHLDLHDFPGFQEAFTGP